MQYILAILRDFLIDGKMPIDLITETFKFDPESEKKDVYLGVEFIKGEVPYYYGLTINQGVIVEEELHISGLGKKEDKVLFFRKDKPGPPGMEHLSFLLSQQGVALSGSSVTIGNRMQRYCGIRLYWAYREPCYRK